MSNKAGIAMAQLSYEDSQSMHELETDIEEVIATRVEDNSKWMYDTFLMRWVCIEKQFVETNSADSRVLPPVYFIQDSPDVLGLTDDLDTLSESVAGLNVCPSCYVYMSMTNVCDFCA